MSNEFDNLDLKCFGDLDIVFPMGEDGLRTSPEKCLSCALKTECLRKAMTKKNGLKMREEYVDRAYDSGMMGFFQRWSRKKHLQGKLRKKEQSEKE